MVYGLLGFLLLAAVVKILLLKKSVREIADAFAGRLQTDTNTEIDCSSRDRDLRALAEGINQQLRILRKEHLQYHQGNAELKRAITNVSHDLRTPLTSIYGYLELLEQCNDPEKRRQYLSIMKERAERMKQLTEELFRYSVILSEEQAPETQALLVNQILSESIAAFYPALSERGITPELRITEQRVVRNCNRTALSGVFENLLNNTVKYSDGDLKITLNEQGEIRFSNTAAALSAVDVEQLFDRFYTVEAAHRSTGLGLSIARMLVEQMGGSISAEYDSNRLCITIRL